MKNRIKRVISIVIFLLILLFGYYFLNSVYNFKIPCIFYKITNYYCPGCGITRCLFAIIEGNFYDAFSYNRLVFILLPFIMVYIIYKTYLYVFNKRDKYISRIPNIVWILLIIITLLFGILRNIEVFSYLAP